MYLYITFLIIVLIIAIIETILFAAWNPLCFKYGIPFVIKKIEIENVEQAPKAVAHFIDYMDILKCFKRYEGKIVDEGTFLFRKKLINSGKNNFDGAHGTITVDTENRTITIKSCLGYTYMALMLTYFYFLAFVIFGSEPVTLGLIYSIVILAIIHSIQYALECRKCRQMETEIKRLIDEHEYFLSSV